MASNNSHSQFRPFTALMAILGLVVVLKVSGLVLDGRFALNPISQATAQDAEAPADGAAAANSEAGEAAEDTAEADQPVDVKTATSSDLQQPVLDGTMEKGKRIRLNRPTREVSKAELSLLESLRKRREELDGRANALELRENLLAAAEKRINEKLKALQEFDSKIEARVQQKKKADTEQFAGLVSMYQNMKPKDAARIFSRLDTNVLVGVANRMSPRKLAPILAKMESASAERLTIEIARAASSNGALGGVNGELESLATN